MSPFFSFVRRFSPAIVHFRRIGKSWRVAMRHVVIVLASLMCLAFVVYTRSSSERSLPAMSVSAPNADTTTASSGNAGTVRQAPPRFQWNGGGIGGGQFGGAPSFFSTDWEEQREAKRQAQLARM